MQIEIADGVLVQVDDADAGLVHAHRWKLRRSNAIAYVTAFQGRRTIRLHRMIVGAAAGDLVDHINGDPLDNRRVNLRLVTPVQSAANSRGFGVSHYRGVHFAADKRRWRARILVDGRKVHLGYFVDEAAAALAWNAAAVERWGEFARLNVVPAGA